MTGNPLDTRSNARNIAAKSATLDRIDGALAGTMQRGFWGRLMIEIPFEDGIAQRGKVVVEQHTPILA